jgi:hypothetical protein
METQTRTEREARTRWRLAHLACLCLGMSMLFWGVASVLIERMVGRGEQDASAFALHSSLFLVGVIYLGLHLLVRQGVRWALWATFVLSSVLFLTTVGFSFLLKTHTANTYLLVLSFACGLASWLALAARNEARDAEVAQAVASRLAP